MTYIFVNLILAVQAVNINCQSTEVLESLNTLQETFCTNSSEPCKTLSECSAFAVLDDEIEVSECEFPDGALGVCCPSSALEDRPPPVGIGEAFQISTREKPIAKPKIPNEQISFVTREGPKYVRDQIHIENSLVRKAGEVLSGNMGNFQPTVQRETPSFGHFKFFGGDKETLYLAYQAVAVAEASKILQTKFNLSPRTARLGLTTFSIKNTTLKSACPVPPLCSIGSKYRTIDGSCNNIENPLWGKSRTAFNRILDSMYGDGIWTLRHSKDGEPLPLARLISTRIVSDVDIPRRELSLFVMQWGQFIDHDLTHTPTFTLRDEKGIECCSSSGFILPPQYRHRQCIPLEVPINDPFFAKYKKTCMNFVRSAIAPRPDCTLGPTEQMNQISHWLDGSMVYGSTDKVAQELRSLRGGELKVLPGRNVGSALPPIQRRNDEDCANDVCFAAGDKRVNEQPLLTAMHTLFIREHNRIAVQLSSLNPTWSDEHLYQEARRIVAAEIQHITFNEWLPNIIGRKFMEVFSLYPTRQGYFSGYDGKIDPRMTNEFAAAAFRFGHSLLPRFIRVIDEYGKKNQSYQLSDFFNDGSGIRNPSHLDNLVRGMLTEPCQSFDSSVTSEITNKLFRGKHKHGLDLVAMNIQRGRDHGLPGYNSYRGVCGLNPAKKFDDLIGTMTPDMVYSLRRVYKHVDDIDLFVGGIAEMAAPGALLGPIFTCLVGDQFARLRLGDRFFYDIGNQPHSFSLAQLKELRKISMARILCDNSDGTLTEVQPLVFRLPIGLNKKISCRSSGVPKINLGPWYREPV